MTTETTTPGKLNMVHAIKGKMGTTEYFTAMLPLKEIPNLVRYAGYAGDVPVQDRKQRVMNMRRVVRDMVPYLVRNQNRFYSSVVLEASQPVSFTPEDDKGYGTLVIDPETVFEPLDGQHRLKSIEGALKVSPEIGEETISIIIVQPQSIAVSQQMFADLNRNAKPPQRSLGITFEHRQSEAVRAKELSQCRYLAGHVNFLNAATPARSDYITSISTLYEVTKILTPSLVNAEGVGESALIKVWETVLTTLPGIVDMEQKKVSPAQIRQTYFYSTGLGQEAIAMVTGRLVTQNPTDWEEIVKARYAKVDWTLANPEWEGIAMNAGRLATGRAARTRASLFIAYKLGLALGEGEIDDLNRWLSVTGKGLPEKVVKEEEMVVVGDEPTVPPSETPTEPDVPQARRVRRG